MIHDHERIASPADMSQGLWDAVHAINRSDRRQLKHVIWPEVTRRVLHGQIMDSEIDIIASAIDSKRSSIEKSYNKPVAAITPQSQPEVNWSPTAIIETLAPVELSGRDLAAGISDREHLVS